MNWKERHKTEKNEYKSTVTQQRYRLDMPRNRRNTTENGKKNKNKTQAVYWTCLDWKPNSTITCHVVLVHRPTSVSLFPYLNNDNKISNFLIRYSRIFKCRFLETYLKQQLEYSINSCHFRGSHLLHSSEQSLSNGAQSPLWSSHCHTSGLSPL